MTEDEWNETKWSFEQRQITLKRSAISFGCIEIIENQDGVSFWTDMEEKILKIWKGL